MAESNVVMRAFLMLQDQLHATQLAVESNRQEAEEAAARDSATISNRLAAIEQSVLVQRANELADAQRNNRLFLIIIGSFAIVGFVTALFTAYFQWRTVGRLADISTAMPAVRELPALPATTVAAVRERELLSNGRVDQANSRFAGLIERLEKRIRELETAAVVPLPEPSNSSNGEAEHSSPAEAPEPAAGPDYKAENIALLLERGQTLLNSDRPEEALACFNEVLGLNPNHADALVKKGSVLEKMRQPQEALECYDRAISADGSMTIAYLHKGGLCNRLERYGEAMECYERALHTQERNRAA